MMGRSSDEREPADAESEAAAEAAAAAAETTHENGGSSEAGGYSSIIPGVVDEIDKSGGGGGGGNRWPRQETLALLKIRSDMDVAFRDSSLKGPLWEEVSRKMAELGFQRSSKKCREKFENVYKYHKRTKDGRAAKSDGKTYRFFDQLEALENTHPNPFAPPPLPQRQQSPARMAVPANAANLSVPSHVTVSSISPTPLSVVPPQAGTNPIDSSSPFQQSQPPLQHLSGTRNNSVPPPQSHPYHQSSHTRALLSDSTSSSTSSDDDIQQQRRRGKKRKWKECFQRLMKDVIQKQEELQKKFLDTLDKRERDRMAREEAWRVQEMARLNREHDLLVQERSIAAAKDAAVIAFLQKVTDQHNLQIPINNAPPPPQPPENPPPPRQSEPPPPPPPPQHSALQPPALTVTPIKAFDISKTTADNGGGGGGESFSPASSSRWPKAEVQALINLRTSLDLKYQDNGPKGPLWEEISSAMAKLGYNRSSKRCKEKWENINKYFKKVKESNKKRPEDSKTCPYFHQLEAIYKERAKNEAPPAAAAFYPLKPENPMVPIMAQPEQQWPIANTQQQQQQHHGSSIRDQDRDSDDPNINDHEEDDEDDEDEEEDEAMGYEIMANKQQSSVANTAEES
ncbi:trihelix transcription factor DF1-like [Andrographis paniculata]|uniref:trihelix transcription factor DF1-like n=1 Tax=Andrographis paniculata TaxID=175694 RepID=UPI0021E84443|nr:trihelix transcription factor DF1-like [Andrographis paniculata]